MVVWLVPAFVFEMTKLGALDEAAMAVLELVKIDAELLVTVTDVETVELGRLDEIISTVLELTEIDAEVLVLVLLVTPTEVDGEV